MAGVAACSLLLFGVRLVIPTRADIASDPILNSDNNTSRLLGLLPDFEKIYREALTLPFIKAESKIYDQDIARYYRALMDSTGLAPREEEP